MPRYVQHILFHFLFESFSHTKKRNYERELTLHSQARTDLRAATEEAEMEQRARMSAEGRLQNIDVEFSEEKQIFAKEKAALEGKLKEQEKALEDVHTQNVILHEQLEKIGDQIQNIQEDTTLVEDSVSSNSSNNNVELQKTITELREVIKFVRSEKQIIRVQLDVARREADRDRAAAEVARQSLESIRTEIRQVKESAEPFDQKNCQVKLDNSERRCQLLEESNAHLRDEIKKCEQKVTVLTKDLEDSKQGAVAIDLRQKVLEAKNAGLDSERESLRREVNDWKGRVQALVTQFNQVCPCYT